MNILDFKRILTSFADKPSDLQLEKGILYTEIRGEIIQAKVITRDNVLFVQEGDVESNAIHWIKNRIACLPQLADRIIDFVQTEENFIDPCGKLLDEIEFDPEETEKDVDGCVNTLSTILDRKIPGISSILYLTSDAGEGKTTLINTLAHEQAKKFKEKKTDWLLLPIQLGGRPFLRFDDIVIASIVNVLRFRFFYYESFLELVGLGLIVPAFDGFEEMFMQSSTGEALSATGGLINKLNSSGSVLIAARKAYFDYKSFSSQAKLFDTISSSVSFARLAICRWNRDQFIKYLRIRKVSQPEEIYELCIAKLGQGHPILTRPVLVKKLVDVFETYGNMNDLMLKLESSINYFPAFVNAIIEREANFKWIDVSGEPYKPILTVDQHYELLSLLAEEMWINNSDSLNDSIMDLLSELFSEHHKFDVQTNRQIKERIKQHALIVRAEPNNPSYKFDHDEFREFFLGVSIADKIASNQTIETKSIFRRAPFSQQTIESLIARLKSLDARILDVKNFFDEIARGEGQTSFVRENIGNLILKIIGDQNVEECVLHNYEFPTNSLIATKINNVYFQNCHFQNTSFYSSTIQNSKFLECYFDRIELFETSIFENVVFINSEIASVYDNVKDKGYYDPFTINRFLTNKNIKIELIDQAQEVSSEKPKIEDDEDLELTEKALRRFLRSNNSINDNIFRMRLGHKSEYFFKSILPDLLSHKILQELDFDGQGQKRRFRLGVSFTKIESAMSEAEGRYQKFLEKFKN